MYDQFAGVVISHLLFGDEPVTGKSMFRLLQGTKTPSLRIEDGESRIENRRMHWVASILHPRYFLVTLCLGGQTQAMKIFYSLTAEL